MDASRSAGSVAAALVALAAAGCSAKQDWTFWFHASPGFEKKASVGARGFAQVKAKRNGAGLTLRPNRELWKSFRVEATLGLYDPAHASLGTDGKFGISILEAGGAGRFYVIQVKRSGDGIVVEAGTGGPPTGSFTLADALVADVAFESIGGQIVMSARRHGDPDFGAIAPAFAPSEGPYQISFDVSGIPKGTVVGCDFVRVPFNGAAPAPTLGQQARETVYTAIDSLLEAVYAMENATPDRTAAGDAVDLAVTRFEAALAMDLSTFGTARARVASALKKARPLAARIRGTQKAAAFVKAIRAAVVLAGRGAQELN